MHTLVFVVLVRKAVCVERDKCSFAKDPGVWPRSGPWWDIYFDILPGTQQSGKKIYTYKHISVANYSTTCSSVVAAWYWYQVTGLSFFG